MTTKEERKKEKRERILKEATLLFAKNGYAETTISQVANAADISFGSVFSYFDNKDALFEAAVIEPLDELKNLMLNYQLEMDHLYHSLRDMVIKHTEYFASHEPYIRLIQQVLGHYQRFPKLFNVLNDYVKLVKERYENIILIGQESGVLRKTNPLAVAESYIAYLNGIRLTFIDPPETLYWHDLALQGFELFHPIHKEENA